MNLCKVDWVAFGTWALAAVTLLLYRATRNLAVEAQRSLEQQRNNSKTELAVRLYLEIEEKFEGKEMLVARSLSLRAC
jgi:hypothetical protein